MHLDIQRCKRNDVVQVRGAAADRWLRLKYITPCAGQAEHMVSEIT